MDYKIQKTINRKRCSNYGPPDIDFKKSSGMLSALGYRKIEDDGSIRDLLPQDISIIQMCVKLSRLSHTLITSPHKDTIDDLHGYVNTLEYIVYGETNRKSKKQVKKN